MNGGHEQHGVPGSWVVRRPRRTVARTAVAILATAVPPPRATGRPDVSRGGRGDIRAGRMVIPRHGGADRRHPLAGLRPAVSASPAGAPHGLRGTCSAPALLFLVALLVLAFADVLLGGVDSTVDLLIVLMVGVVLG